MLEAAGRRNFSSIRLMLQQIIQSTRDLIDDKILKHFRDSHNPVSELGLASAVGLVWALTPLGGIQMILVTINWAIFRIFRLHFHLVIGVARVWLSNPLSMVPLNYSFYITGYYFLSRIGVELTPVSASAFSVVLDESAAMSMTDGLWHWVDFMIVQLGWPMLIGGFVMGVPFSIAGYPITVYFVKRFRKRKARQMGISYEEWEQRFVRNRTDSAPTADSATTADSETLEVEATSGSRSS